MSSAQPLQAPPPPPPPSPSGMTTLRFLHWNVSHGGTRTDGVYDPNGLTNWIVSWNPDVISLNEIDNANAAANDPHRLDRRARSNSAAGAGDARNARSW